MKIFIDDELVYETDDTVEMINRMAVDSERGNHMDIPVGSSEYRITFQKASLISKPLDLVEVITDTPAGPEITLEPEVEAAAETKPEFVQPSFQISQESNLPVTKEPTE